MSRRDAEPPLEARPRTRLYRNDWSVLRPPAVGEWQPTRTVSVIIPAYNCQQLLDLTLASLSHQTYPEDLLEVVVVDDTSEPAIELPKIRPSNCRIVRVADHSSGWGSANARHVGALNSTGEILQWLDADMVVFPEHVEAHARWHHVSDEVVTLGYKRFVGSGWATPEEVSERCAAGTIDTLFRVEETEPHDYIEKIIDETDQLRGGNHLNFRAHVSATAALTRELYEETGGYDLSLRLGEDSEFGYRLAQVGAAFVPEPLAKSWHMGASHMMSKGAELRRFNLPYLTDRMAQPHWLRTGANRSWAVPMVTAVVPAEARFEVVRACVDRLLASDLTDLRVMLVAPWSELRDDRRAILADPLMDRRLLWATYHSEPRVELIEHDLDTAYPSPFLLRLDPYVGVDGDTARRMVAAADRSQAGLVRVESDAAPSAAASVTLWRTAAVSRARRVRRADEPLHAALTEVAGEDSVNGDELGVIDLRLLSEEELISPKPRLMVRPRPAPAVAPRTVPVGGLRSLATATGFVAKRYVTGAVRRVVRKAAKAPRPTGKE